MCQISAFCRIESLLLLLHSIFPKTCSAPRYLGRVQLHKGPWPESFHSNREERLAERKLAAQRVSLLESTSWLSFLSSTFPGWIPTQDGKAVTTPGQTSTAAAQGLFSQRGRVRDDFPHGLAALPFLTVDNEHDYLGTQIIKWKRGHCSCCILCKAHSPTFCRLLSAKIPSMSCGLLRAQLNPAQIVNPQSYELNKWCLLQVIKF